MKQISAKELNEILSKNSEEIEIIDVRTLPEHKQTKIPNSKLISLQDLQSSIDKFKEGKNYILYCHTGGRSKLAQSILNSKGIKALNLDGGMLAWTSRGYPTK